MQEQAKLFADVCAVIGIPAKTDRRDHYERGMQICGFDVDADNLDARVWHNRKRRNLTIKTVAGISQIDVRFGPDNGEWVSNILMRFWYEDGSLKRTAGTVNDFHARMPDIRKMRPDAALRKIHSYVMPIISANFK